MTDKVISIYGCETNSPLTDSVNGAEGSAVLDGLEVWPGQTGFSATFNLTTGPGSIPNPGDGASFSVGTLPNDYSWGEDGPYPDDSPRNLTIVFDTYGFNTGFETSRGIKIRVNGGLVLYSSINPYSNGAARAVEITYTPTEGLSVKFNGSSVFTGVGLGFALQPGDRYGFGGRTSIAAISVGLTAALSKSRAKRANASSPSARTAAIIERTFSSKAERSVSVR